MQSLSLIILQLAIITIMTKLMGDLFRNSLKLPQVLGELISGIIIGPSLLGGISLVFLGDAPLFPLAPHEMIPPIINEFSILAVVILLFIAGLETDITKFLRYSGIATFIALGGFILSFLLGALTPVMLLPSVTSIMDPPALLLGVLATATSVGITARILTDMHKMATPEAVTTLAAAVLDDVLGILALTTVVGLLNTGAHEIASTGNAWIQIGSVAAKALLFTIGIGIISILFAPRLVRSMKHRHSIDTNIWLLVSVALAMAFLAELSGLAVIVGGYLAGLALSRTDIANELHERLHGLYQFLVPIFFASMGMMVDLRSFISFDVLFFGFILGTVCIFAKIVGSGACAMLSGFRIRGALRIGIGMIPRGEVTLIIAGTGFAMGAISHDIFAATFITILLTGILAPPLLQLVFKGGSGHKNADSAHDDIKHIDLELPSAAVASFFAEKILDAFRNEEYFVNTLDRERRIHQIRKEMLIINLNINKQNISILFAEKHMEFVRLLIVESMVELQDIFRDLQDFQSISIVKDIGSSLESSNKKKQL